MSTIFNSFYNAPLWFLYPFAIFLILGAAEAGVYFGRRYPNESSDFATPTGGALGLLALLLGFSFALSLERFDERRHLVLSEANAINNAANYALILPQPPQDTILGLMHQYIEVRVSLGVPFDPEKFNRDVARSIELQRQLWNEATKISASDRSPGPETMNHFFDSLSAINDLHEERVTALRYHVPGVVTSVLLGIALIAVGFAGYHAGTVARGRHIAIALTAIMVALVMSVIVDLDRPARGLINVSTQPLLDAVQRMPAVEDHQSHWVRR
jgi:hypothetical protein